MEWVRSFGLQFCHFFACLCVVTHQSFCSPSFPRSTYHAYFASFIALFILSRNTILCCNHSPPLTSFVHILRFHPSSCRTYWARSPDTFSTAPTTADTSASSALCSVLCCLSTLLRTYRCCCAFFSVLPSASPCSTALYFSKLVWYVAGSRYIHTAMSIGHLESYTSWVFCFIFFLSFLPLAALRSFPHKLHPLYPSSFLDRRRIYDLFLFFHSFFRFYPSVDGVL